MKNDKEFDCVKMKNEIQEMLSEEWKGMTDEEIRDQIRNDLMSSSDPISEKWQRILKRKKEKTI